MYQPRKQERNNSRQKKEAKNGKRTVAEKTKENCTGVANKNEKPHTKVIPYNKNKTNKPQTTIKHQEEVATNITKNQERKEIKLRHN